MRIQVSGVVRVPGVSAVHGAEQRKPGSQEGPREGGARRGRAKPKWPRAGPEEGDVRSRQGEAEGGKLGRTGKAPCFYFSTAH